VASGRSRPQHDVEARPRYAKEFRDDSQHTSNSRKPENPGQTDLTGRAA